MHEIGPDVVNRGFLSNVRESVDALIELAESQSESSALLALVKKTVKDEFYKAALKITEQINRMVQQYNNRECVIAGVSPEKKGSGDDCMSMNIFLEVRKIGMRKIGETAAYSLTIDDEEVPGTGIPDKLAIRLFRAIEAFRIKRNDKRVSHE